MALNFWERIQNVGIASFGNTLTGTSGAALLLLIGVVQQNLGTKLEGAGSLLSSFLPILYKFKSEESDIDLRVLMFVLGVDMCIKVAATVIELGVRQNFTLESIAAAVFNVLALVGRGVELGSAIRQYFNQENPGYAALRP